MKKYDFEKQTIIIKKQDKLFPKRLKDIPNSPETIYALRKYFSFR